MPAPRRGAPLKPLVDTTGLGDARIDVGVRVGWTLRMARLTAGEQPLTQADLLRHLQAAGRQTNSTAVHRAEAGGHRAGAVVDVWEEALGLPSATLRAPIDILCRTFPYSPADQDPGRVPGTLAEMDQVLAPVLEGATTGGQWLRWARAVVHVGGLGMSRGLAEQLVARCVSEMGRAIGTGYHARYEALSLLRCSEYGEVVLDAARTEVADPHVQVLLDLMSLVGEACSETAMRWAGSLLRDEREHVVVGAAICLENMVTVQGDFARLAEVADDVVAAYRESQAGTERRRWVTHVVRLMPPALHRRVRERLDGPLGPAPAAAAPTPDDEPWTTCAAHSLQITRELGVDAQPLLTRLLHDLAFSPYEARGVTTGMLLCAQPALAGPVAVALAELGEEHPQPSVRTRCLRRVSLFEGGAPMPPRVLGWLDQGDGARLATALRYAGATGHPVDDAPLDRCLEAGGGLRRAAVRLAGMRGGPTLARLVEHRDPEVAGAAQWWHRHGSVVLDGGERV